MISVARVPRQHNEDDYEMFLSSIKTHFNDAIECYGKSLFETDTTGLFDVFLSYLPKNMRQHYTCNTCRKFVDEFGGLVAITSQGETVPVMWPEEVPHIYQRAVNSIKMLIEKNPVRGVFFGAGDMWGKLQTGPWHHMGIIPNGVTFDDPLRTPSQAMAEKREDYKNLLNGLKEFPLEAVGQAIKVLKSDLLYRSEKVLGIAEWLKDIHILRKNKKRIISKNLTWQAVAIAPSGFCHIKSSMIGTLLDDIVAGLPFEEISRRFSAKMDPLQYQRPQSSPTAGNIEQAEKVIGKLNAAGSLERRFARLDEVQLIWCPRPSDPPGTLNVREGVFSHIKPKDQLPIKEVDLPPVTMTWKKFLDVVMDGADTIEYYASHRRENYVALVTTVDEEAPPILQWDLEDQRNPVSWYVHNEGSFPDDWGLENNLYHRVTGICFLPSMWYGDFSHLGEGVIFLIDGAKDILYKSYGNALFPELLKTEFHAIRATIEAYSKNALLQGASEASACGVALWKGDKRNITFRVLTEGSKIEYKLDRWD